MYNNYYIQLFAIANFSVDDPQQTAYNYMCTLYVHIGDMASSHYFCFYKMLIN